MVQNEETASGQPDRIGCQANKHERREEFENILDNIASDEMSALRIPQEFWPPAKIAPSTDPTPWVGENGDRFEFDGGCAGARLKFQPRPDRVLTEAEVEAIVTADNDPLLQSPEDKHVMSLLREAAVTPCKRCTHQRVDHLSDNGGNFCNNITCTCEEFIK